MRKYDQFFVVTAEKTSSDCDESLIRRVKSTLRSLLTIVEGKNAIHPLALWTDPFSGAEDSSYYYWLAGFLPDRSSSLSLDLETEIISEFEGIANVKPNMREGPVLTLKFKSKFELVDLLLIKIEESEVFSEVYRALNKGDSWWEDRHFVKKVKALSSPEYVLQVFW